MLSVEVLLGALMLHCILQEAFEPLYLKKSTNHAKKQSIQ